MNMVCLIIIINLYSSYAQVKKVLAQTVIAMAHHNYLEMEGGHLYIKFIVDQCALPSDPQVGCLRL